MVVKMKSYVPPAKRATKAEVKDVNINVNDEKEFPTMGAVVHKKWEGKSFKQKIEDLIAFDKISAAERKAAKDAKDAMLGWHTLTLPKTHADFEKIHDRIIQFNTEFKRIQELKDLGLYIEPIEYVNHKTMYKFEDDYSDSELASDE
jgi:hypothetical protein